MILGTCKICGKEFKATQNKTTYCSISCYRRNHVIRQVERRKVTKIYYNKDNCPKCGRLKTKSANLCYICTKVKNAKKEKVLKSDLIYKVCRLCGNQFVTERVNRIYCSLDCDKKSNRINRGKSREKRYGVDRGFMKYDGVILHDGNCVICGYDRFVEYHHISTRRVVALCPNHHRLIHRDALTSEEKMKLEGFKSIQQDLFEQRETGIA